MNLLENLEWRYSTKHFDSSRKVSQDNISKLKEAINLSVSAYRLQPYKVIIVENDEIKQKLRDVSWGQSQITDSSHLFVFCNYTNINDKHVDDYINLTASTQNIDPSIINDYSNFMKGDINSRNSSFAPLINKGLPDFSA
ncbi:MAG: nitroreductase family protein [Flavobacteriaceae bacterium]|nr:nitroreductase family protein [Flavobacteriaceae bacterium]